MNGWKKRLPALIICCMLGLLIGCSAQEAEKTPDAVPSAVPAEDVKETGEKTGRYTPGTYEGTAVGMNGEVRVRVTFDEDAITEVEIVEHVETPLISDLALSRIPEEIVAFQSLAVDTVTGATLSSHAVLNAVAGAAEEAGGDPEALRNVAIPEKEPQPDQSMEVDVLVVGGGLSGMSTAYETASAGLETLLVEKLESWGGSSARSGGAVCYATEEGDPVGYFSAEQYYQWFQNMGHGQINDDLVRKIAYMSNDTVQWMRSEIGYDPQYEMTERFVDGTVARLTNPGSPTEYVTGAGGGMMKIFYDRISGLESLTMMNQTEVVSLTTDAAGAVTGAVAERTDGSTLTIEAKAVVLATGGWAAGEEYMELWAPGMKKAYNMAGVGSDGDGIHLAEEVGASITYDTPSFAGGVYAPVAAAPANCLLVDGNGNRFVAEDAPAWQVLAAMMRNETGTFYQIYDEAQSEGMFEGVSVVLKADTLEELAEQMGAEAAVLQKTVDRYCELAGREDTDFGKDAALMTGIGEGPYYAVNVTTYILTAYAGPDITEDCEVLAEAGGVIPGLYGVGELIATNIYGYDDGGHGATLQYCMSTGRIAAGAIMESLQSGG